MELRRVAEALADVVAVPVTPYGDGGQIDLATFRRLLRRLVDSGVRVLTVNGNTGEFYALSPAERQALVEAAAAEVGADAVLVVGVGLDLESARDDARQAARLGADAVMVHQPAHPYVSAAGWVDYHAAIADAVPAIGVVPYVRAATVTGEQLARLKDRCPTVVGVKYAVPDPVRFAAVVTDAARRGGSRLTWVAGLAEPYAPSAWAAGARGFTSGLVNVAPRLALELLAALRAGDTGQVGALWAAIRPFEELRAADGSADNVSVVKEAMAQLGLCRPDVRPPSHAVSPRVRAAVEQILADWHRDA